MIECFMAATFIGKANIKSCTFCKKKYMVNKIVNRLHIQQTEKLKFVAKCEYIIFIKIFFAYLIGICWF